MEKYYVIGVQTGKDEINFVSGYTSGKTLYSTNIEEALDLTKQEARVKLAGSIGWAICLYVTRENNRITKKTNVTKQMTPEVIDGTWIDLYYSREDRAFWLYLRNKKGDQVADALNCATAAEADRIQRSDFTLWDLTAAPRTAGEMILRLKGAAK